jgi:thiol-disulfide isomerase/thioredoxin
MSLLDSTYSCRAVRLGLTALFATLLCALARAEVKVGDIFPPLVAADLAGTLPATEGKVVLMDFWASWCAPCKVSFPSYARLQNDYARQGLVLVAISVDQDSAAYEAFVKKLAPPFTVLRDKDQQLVRQVTVPAMPTCFLLGRDGRVRFVHRGFRGAETEREIRKQLDLLLAEKPNSL